MAGVDGRLAVGALEHDIMRIAAGEADVALMPALLSGDETQTDVRPVGPARNFHLGLRRAAKAVGHAVAAAADAADLLAEAARIEWFLACLAKPRRGGCSHRRRGGPGKEDRD